MRAVRLVVLGSLAALVIGCRSSTTGPTQGVTALAGSIVAEAGATILSHRADGTILDDQTADATGHADVQIEPGAYVSAIFPALIAPLPTTISIVTAPITSDDSELVIHGPPHATVPLVVAGLTVTGPALAGATSFTVDLGCNTQTEPSLPAIVDVIAPCEGTDTNIDILVQGFDDTQTMLGYAAAREPIGQDQAGNAIADLAVASWMTTGIMVPVTQTGTTATVELDLISDTLPFPTPAITDQALVWNGLVVDSSVVSATMGDQVATQYALGSPTAIAIGTTDFMGEISPAALQLDTTLDATWPALAITGPDAIALQLTWMTTSTIFWDAVLAPDTTQIAFPQLDPTTQQVISLPTDPTTITGQLSAIDSSDLGDFDDLEAAGIFASSTIVPTPATGEIRTSSASL
jgi:hypothetical protein